MKILRVLSLFIIVSLLIGSSVIYQSCKPIRQCQLLLGIDMLPVNYTTNDTLESMDSVKASDLTIHVNLKRELFSCKAETGFSFIQPAMAYKPVVHTVYYDTIKRITIFSDQDFDSAHPAGTLLNDLFQIPDPYPSLVYSEQNFDHHYFLSKAPDTETYHRFSVKVEISGSLPYDTIFPPIKILQ